MGKTANYSEIRMLKRREMIAPPDDPEAKYGVVETADPGPDGLGGPRELYLATETIKGAPVEKESEIANSNRQPGPTVRVGGTGAGPINTELAPGPQADEFLEEGLCGLYSTALDISAITISAAAIDNSLNGSGGNEFADVQPGTWVRIGGFPVAGNNTDGQSGRGNGAYVLSKPNDGKIILAYHTLVDDPAGPNITIKEAHARDGKILIASTLERHHTDLVTHAYQAYTGQVLGQIDVSMTFQEFMKVTANFTGRAPRARAAASVWDGLSVVAAEDLSDLLADASNNMRAFRAGGVLDGNIKVFNWSLNNNTQYIDVAQVTEPQGVSLGTKRITGQCDGHLIDADGRPGIAHANDLTDFHVEVVPKLSTAPVYIFTFWRCRFTEYGDTPKSQKDGPVMLQLPFRVEPHPTFGMMQVSRLPRT